MRYTAVALLCLILLAGWAVAESSCPRCDGSGVCAVCWGTGNSDGHRCTMCHGCGKCWYCSGTGHL